MVVILIAAVLTTAFLMFLVRLPGMMSNKLESITVEEQNGVYDLKGIKNFSRRVVILLPGSVYYPNLLLTPENYSTAVPESTDSTDRYDKLRADYLSQRFVINLPSSEDVYMLTFRLSGRHAMRAYVNGQLVGQSGQTGVTKQDTEVWENNLTCYAAPKEGKMEIILQSAQFYHYKRGASLATLRLSMASQGFHAGLYDKIKGLLVMGALLCAAVLLLCIYLLKWHTRVPLYFSLACFSMALRECIQSQVWTYFSFLSGKLSFMLEYLSVVLLTIFLTLYLAQSLTGCFWRVVKYITLSSSGVYGMCLLFGDSIFYTSVLIYYQVLLVVCIACAVVGIFWKMRCPIDEQAAALYGIAVFYFAAVSDILMYNNVFGDLHPKVSVSEAAMMVFVLAQIISLFLTNNRLIAEAKEAEQRIIAEKEALASINRMKTEFFGNISHELKTPLVVVSGYAQTTMQLVERSGEIDRKEVTCKMKLISSEVERLSLMVRQILDVTCIEEGRMRMDKVLCYVDEIIYAAIETYYPILNKNANRLEIRIDGVLPMINADPVRVSRVIVNLISNAIRFTVNGTIIVAAQEKHSYIVVSVADTGVGIGPEKLPFIFERYNNKQRSGGGQDIGTGLGLYICKYIIEGHSGKIWVQSEKGKGTTVSFTLPVG
ncbi:histidine kinase [Clostridium kluyveri]|uniref:histidine kinase n=1 Tax=Clostridium kluyveri TaxID=1534 RepID=A0A1L5F6U6_CLOKL|nr:histidine kinase [Clostridium kluyveri]